MAIERLKEMKRQERNAKRKRRFLSGPHYDVCVSFFNYRVKIRDKIVRYFHTQ